MKGGSEIDMFALYTHLSSLIICFSFHTYALLKNKGQYKNCVWNHNENTFTDALGRSHRWLPTFLVCRVCPFVQVRPLTVGFPSRVRKEKVDVIKWLICWLGVNQKRRFLGWPDLLKKAFRRILEGSETFLLASEGPHHERAQVAGFGGLCLLGETPPGSSVASLEALRGESRQAMLGLLTVETMKMNLCCF